jgi:Concanavalin A-like lectin/glucanases superfamily
MFSTHSSTFSFGKMGKLTANTQIITSNLVMQLDASNTSSYQYPEGTNVWYDLTANDLDATLVNGPGFTWQTGGIDVGADAHFVFDGFNSATAGHANVAHDSRLSLSTTQIKTFQLWIKFDAAALTVNDSTIVNKISSSYNNDGYTLRVNSNGSMRILTDGGSISKSTTGHASKFVANKWYFITVHSAINNTANSTRVYVNSNTTPYIDTEHGTDTYDESNTLTLGLPGAGTGGTFLKGARIAAFYFYDKQLSQAEILANFTATKWKFGVTPKYGVS